MQKKLKGFLSGLSAILLSFGFVAFGACGSQADTGGGNGGGSDGKNPPSKTEDPAVPPQSDYEDPYENGNWTDWQK